jgi:hypothetical protein
MTKAEAVEALSYFRFLYGLFKLEFQAIVLNIETIMYSIYKIFIGCKDKFHQGYWFSILNETGDPVTGWEKLFGHIQ